MKCPVCPDSTLAMSNREGIEIDYCPTCRGVWLDRGELDKIIERSASESLPRNEPRSEAPYPREQDDRYRGRDHRGDDPDERYRDPNYHKRKRKGLLGELFDFD